MRRSKILLLFPFKKEEKCVSGFLFHVPVFCSAVPRSGFSVPVLRVCCSSVTGFRFLFQHFGVPRSEF